MVLAGRIETSSKQSNFVSEIFLATGGFDTTAKEHRRLLNHRV